MEKLLAGGGLPIRLLRKVKRMDVSVNEWMQWEENKPPFHVSSTGKHIFIEADLSIETRKLLTVLGGLVGVISGLIKVSPALQELLFKAIL